MVSVAVVAGEREAGRVHRHRSGTRNAGKFMAAGLERSSKPLHNFPMPCLRWGNQKFLRCVKVEDSPHRAGTAASVDEDDFFSADRRRSPLYWFEAHTAPRRRDPDAYRRRRETERARFPAPKIGADDECEGIDAVREKLMYDLKAAANKMKDAILREEAVAAAAAHHDDRVEPRRLLDSSSTAALVEEPRPWNLRTRKAPCKVPPPAFGGTGTAKALKVEERKPNYSPLRGENSSGSGVRSPRMKSSAGAVAGTGTGAATEKREKERTKFSLSLSKKEIEEDYMAILGERPPRRPKKRPRNLQKELDALFPGSWLTEITADTYKVPELPENGKM